MATKKTTSKKLADMMYGEPTEAELREASRPAFGIYPLIGKRREDRQDRQAAKNFPVDLARGVLAGAVGIPGDIESLARLPYELITGNDSPTFLPTSEDVLKRIPFGSDTPAGQFASGLGTLAGGSANLGAIPRAVKAAPGALKAVARNLSTPSTLNPQAGVIKPKGGNFIGGRLMGNMDESVKRLRPYTKAGDDGTFLQKDLRSAKYRLEILESDPYKNDAMVAGQKRTIEDIEKKIAINNWVTNNLGKYTKNQMATPEDPIRLLLDKRTKEIDAKHAKDMERAERVSKRAMDEPDPRRQANLIRESERLKMEANVERQFAMDSIIPSRMQDYSPDADYALRQRRVDAGFPAEGMGESEAAKRYETLTDDAISSIRAGDVQDVTKLDEEIRRAEDEFRTYRLDMSKRFDERLINAGLSDKHRTVLNEKTRDKEKANILNDGKYDELMAGLNKLNTRFDQRAFDAGKENPFIAKLDPETTLYSGNTADMGFDHVIDILKQDVMEGRIRPEQLSKVSVEDAVRRTMEFDQEAARKMAETQIKATEGFPVVKEYPEGFRWIELAPRNVEELRAVHADFVRKDFPDLEGADPTKFATYVEDSMTSASNIDQKKLADALKYEGDTMGHCVGGYCPDVVAGKSRIFSLRDAKGEPHVTVEVSPEADYDKAAELLGIDDPTQGDIARLVAEGKLPGTEKIVQIKGKQNARPIEKYDKYTQDFVRSGTYSSVGDLQNTGLIRKSDLIDKFSADELDSIGAGEYLTKGEQDDLLLKALNARSPGLTDEIGLTTPPPAPDGMARGGSVHFSDNPDVMQLELAKGGAIRMQAGGLAKAAKAAAKALKPAEAPMKASEALGRIEGRPLVITQADRTKVGGGFLGGPGFSGLQLEDPAYRAAEAAWAVKNPGTAKMILGGRGESKDAVYAAMLGTPTQHQSNQMVFDKLLGDFKKAAKKGGLEPELRDRINMRLANSVDKDGNNIFPPDVDILDKNFKDLASTFDRRSVTANLIGGMGVGGKKGQIIDYDKIIRQTTDPMLLESPTGALGNRLFTLSGGIIDRPDLHPAFPTIMQGEDLGVSFDPVARNLIMKDFTEKTMREKGRAPGIFDYTRGYPPSQLITEDILTELQKMGKKAGGEVKAQKNNEQRVQNPVHFTENPDAMRLALSKRN